MRFEWLTKGEVEFAKEETEQFTLKAVTVNATSWGSAQACLMATDANLVFLQEHKLTDDKIPEATQWTDSEGWNAVWEAAGPSGGLQEE